MGRGAAVGAVGIAGGGAACLGFGVLGVSCGWTLKESNIPLSDDSAFLLLRMPKTLGEKLLSKSHQKSCQTGTHAERQSHWTPVDQKTRKLQATGDHRLNNSHQGDGNQDQGHCFRCGKLGHVPHHCPDKKNGDSTNPKEISEHHHLRVIDEEQSVSHSQTLKKLSKQWWETQNKQQQTRIQIWCHLKQSVPKQEQPMLQHCALEPLHESNGDVNHFGTSSAS